MGIVELQGVASEEEFVESLEQWFTEKGYLAKREVNIGNGVVDLVLAKLNKSKVNLRKRRNQKDSLLKEYFFTALRYIPDKDTGKKPIQMDELQRRTMLSKNLLRYKILRDLEESGHIISTDDNSYLKINGWIPLAKEIVAIEAKLKDWKRGFIQANRYTTCADKVYLAIPEQISHLPDKKLLRSFGIGLLSFSAHQKRLNILIESPNQGGKTNQDKRNYVAEYFWN